MKAVCFFDTSAKVTQLHDAATQKIWFLNSHSAETSNHRIVIHIIIIIIIIIIINIKDWTL